MEKVSKIWGTCQHDAHDGYRANERNRFTQSDWCTQARYLNAIFSRSRCADCYRWNCGHWAWMVNFVCRESNWACHDKCLTLIGSSARGQFSNGKFTGRLDGAAGMGVRVGMNGGGFMAGEILSKDESSITIKMQDGSTKIVLVGSSTQIMKSTTGSSDDLMNGTNVTVTGIANSDGSVTAESVQIRPAGSMPFGDSPRVNQ